MMCAAHWLGILIFLIKEPTCFVHQMWVLKLYTGCIHTNQLSSVDVDPTKDFNILAKQRNETLVLNFLNLLQNQHDISLINRA